MKNNNSILITIVLGICILIGAWYFQVFTDYVFTTDYYSIFYR